MSHSTQLPSHSFRLLLYLEWILLGIAAPTVVQSAIFPQSSHLPPLTILSLLGFGIMGLKLPKEKLFSKILYTSVEFGLVLLPTFLGHQWIKCFPLLCLVMVIRGCLMFKPLGRLGVASLAFISFLLTFLQIPDVNSLRPMMAEQLKGTLWALKLNVAFSFGLTLVFLLLLINALLGERQSRERLMLANEQLRQYALRIEDQAALQERNRIAREIHDSLGHSLTAQSIQLENALMFCQSHVDKSQTFLLEAKRLGTNALQDVRQSVAALRSDPLQGKSLESAIGFLIEEFSQTSGIVPQCTINLSFLLSAEVSTAVYRIVQEALTNIYKHSVATEVTIHLQVKAQELYLLVEDNGKGFNPEQNTTGFGLQGMRERSVALLGQFNIVSKPGSGCRIVAYIPSSRSL